VGTTVAVDVLAAAAIENAGAGAVDRIPVDLAGERLIRAGTTHLDSLGQRLEERRVARILQPIVLGDADGEVDTDDFLYTIDLGLVHPTRRPPEIANPLCREMLARLITLRRQENLNAAWWRWRRAKGGLDAVALAYGPNRPCHLLGSRAA
jgi:hypothetical protein